MKKKVKNYLIIAISTALMGELYFYPFKGDFRFSVGVIVFSLGLLIFDELSEVIQTIFSALSIFVLRFFIEYYGAANLGAIISETFPALLYYLLYGTFVHVLKIKKNKENLHLTVTLLFTIDVFCNIVEASIRHNLDSHLFKYILLIGILRSVISYGIFILIEKQKNIIRKKEHQKRYIQLNTLVSTIQAELFYLKKSASDIESVMSKSYSMYENNKDNKTINEMALDIARDVHEIKKDYHRVLDGFESFLKDFERNDSMSLKDIQFIIENNSRRYMEEHLKNIKFTMTINDNIYIKKYYTIFTILNNLIVNSVDAIEVDGCIEIKQYIDKDDIVFLVFDNGKGIDKNMLPYIFNPGFTTKYDVKTGKASTGIGLSHVKNIVDEMKGNISVKSNSTSTEFFVKIPLYALKIK